MNSSSFGSDRRGGLLGKLLIVLAGCFAVGALAWMLLLPFVIRRVVSAKTGFQVKIQHLYINPFTAYANIEGLVVENPSSFQDRDFVELTQFKADVRVFSIFSDRLVVNDAVVDLPSITIVRRAQGITNIDVLRSSLGSGQTAAANQPAGKTEKQFLIRHLELKFGKVVLADYSGHTPSTHEIPLNIDHTYTDAASITELAAPLTPAITRAGLVGALGALPGPVGSVLSGTANAATDTIKNVSGTATSTLKGLFQKLEVKPKP
jgi:uncharacterized protein involved in outer membrane biogenesis